MLGCWVAHPPPRLGGILGNCLGSGTQASAPVGHPQTLLSSADAAELASTGQATRVRGLPEAAWPQDLGPTSMGTQTQG